MVAVLLRMITPPLQLVMTTAASRAAQSNLPPVPPTTPPPTGSNVNGVKRREGLVASFAAGFALSLSLSQLTGRASAAILEADDDVELLERVKNDRKKRLQRQGAISSSNQETSYLQELVYKLTKVGQAIESDDLPAASSLLGSSTNATWVKNVNTAFNKLSADPEEKVEIDTFNSSLASLFTAVGNRDIESSKSAFVSSASALEKWFGLTGLDAQIKGL